MKAIKFLAFMIASAGMIFTSCQKDSSEVLTASGNNSFGVQLQAVNNTYSFSPGTRAVSAGTLKFDTCQMYVSSVHLTATKEEGDSLSTKSSSFTVELKYKGSKLVDLFNSNSLLGDTLIQQGVYDKIKIMIRSNKKDAGTSPVFYLSGKYTNASGTVTPIALVVNEGLDLSLTAKDSVVINSADDYIALFQLDLSNYMNNSKITIDDLDKATLTNGKIIISEDSNAKLYDKIYKRVSLLNMIKHATFKKVNKRG